MPTVIRVRQDGDDLLLSFEKRRRVRIAKLDTERQMVFGWANVCVRMSGDTIVDSHDDTIEGEDLETAAYDFNLRFREMGEDHEGVAKGRLIESFFVTPEKLVKMGLKKNALPVGWWIGFKVDDRKAWDRVKKGDHRMFSIQGKARRERI